MNGGEVQDELLKEILGFMPKELLSTYEDGGESEEEEEVFPLEKEIKDFCQSILKKHGVEMAPVLP